MFDLMKNKHWFFGISIAFILAGIIGAIVNGFNLDIQFQGGSIIEIEMPDDTFDTTRAEEIVKEAVNKVASAQKLKSISTQGEDKNIDMLMLKLSKDNALTDEEMNKVMEALKKEFNIKDDAQMNVQTVQPFIGQELMRNGLKAALLSIIAIILYVWWRYSTISGLPAAVISVLALIHDTAIMLSVYTIFRIPLNESFIAAVLTILGYSMNDTIIIYDRIRENKKIMKKASFNELVNVSTWQTFSRSVNTTITTMIAIVTVYVFASIYNISSIKEFTFPLIIGLVSGSYSSLFLASPLWAMWMERKTKHKVVAKA